MMKLTIEMINCAQIIESIPVTVVSKFQKITARIPPHIHPYNCLYYRVLFWYMSHTKWMGYFCWVLCELNQEPTKLTTIQTRVTTPRYSTMESARSVTEINSGTWMQNWTNVSMHRFLNIEYITDLTIVITRITLKCIYLFGSQCKVTNISTA